MARIMIKCPTTGADVSTVLRMHQPALEKLSGEYAFRCGACQQIHRWNRDDAWLEGGASAPVAAA